MTNEQLHMLLKQMVARLSAATEAAGELMPETAERESVRRHVQTKCIGLFCREEGHYTTEATGDYRALAPIAELLREWQSDVTALAPPLHEGAT